MSKEKICGIYCIENLINHKKYIGQSIDIYKRWRTHNNDLNNNKHANIHLQASWNRYGKNNFKFSIIEKCCVNELDEKERYYIKIFDTFVNGYNRDIGGTNGKILSDETRELMSNVWKNLSEKERQTRLENNRIAQKSIPIYQIDLKGNIVKLWKCGCREASNKLNIDFSGIWHCVSGFRLTYKNYIWIKVSDYNEYFDVSKYKNSHTQPRRIDQYDLNMNYIKTWTSANQTKEDGFDSSAVIKCCKGKQKYHKDHIFRYKDVEIN